MHNRILPYIEHLNYKVIPRRIIDSCVDLQKNKNGEIENK